MVLHGFCGGEGGELLMKEVMKLLIFKLSICKSCFLVGWDSLPPTHVQKVCQTNGRCIQHIIQERRCVCVCVIQLELYIMQIGVVQHTK